MSFWWVWIKIKTHIIIEILSISNEFIVTQWNNIKWKIYVLISAMTNLWKIKKIIIYVKHNCDIKLKLLHVVKNTSEDQQTTTNKQRLCFKQEDDIEEEITTQGNTCETWFEGATWCDDGAMNEHTRNIVS